MSDIGVLVWDERQPRQQEAYDNFLGNAIAGHLRAQDGLAVQSAGLDDPGQGLSDAALDASQVLVWWGHVRHRDVPAETGRRILDRVIAGRLSLIVLHSAHWATPFVEAMDYRTREDARRRFPDTGGERVELEFVPSENRYQAPAKDAVVTPAYQVRKFPGRVTRVSVQLPICCFPAWRADGQPSFSRTLLPDHPIADGIPAEFSLPQSEMYDEPLHVPDPDEVIFEDRWPTGEWFRGGMVWKIGRGRLFYFRPGHETYPIYQQPIPLRIIENAVRWLALGAIGLRLVPRGVETRIAQPSTRSSRSCVYQRRRSVCSSSLSSTDTGSRSSSVAWPAEAQHVGGLTGECRLVGGRQRALNRHGEGGEIIVTQPLLQYAELAPSRRSEAHEFHHRLTTARDEDLFTALRAAHHLGEAGTENADGNRPLLIVHRRPHRQSLVRRWNGPPGR